MRRRVVIISYDGGEENFLPNLQYDVDNYKSYFALPEAGAWEDHEIRHLNSPSTEVLQRRFIRWRELGIEYYIVIFTGHGYCDEHGNRFVQINDNEDLSVEDLRKLVGEARCLFISDSCGSIWTPGRDRIEDSINEQRTFSAGNEHYADLCREMYNEKVLLAPHGSFVQAYASAFDEAAMYDEDKLHSVYSYYLLDYARRRIRLKKAKRNNRELYTETSSFTFVHEHARQAVVEYSSGRQNPVCVIDKGRQLPFLVVPRRTRVRVV